MKKFSLFLMALVCMSVAQVAFAQSATDGGSWDFKALAALASGLAIGLGAFGGALGQGRAAAAALEGIARNPSAADKIQTPMILGLVFIESLVIYGLVVAILLWTKI
jgi:F-type H+-transporting ATPase subunit c